MNTQATTICIVYMNVLLEYLIIQYLISNTKIAVIHLNECLFETCTILVFIGE